MNSAGMKRRMKWKRILSAGHPGDRKRRHVLGERTRVSHAATVRVQTRKYLCALKCGGRSRDGGRTGAPGVPDISLCFSWIQSMSFARLEEVGYPRERSAVLFV